MIEILNLILNFLFIYQCTEDKYPDLCSLEREGKIPYLLFQMQFFKRGGAGVAASPCWSKNCLVALQVFKIQIFLNVMVYPQTKLWGTKTSLICSRSTNEIFVNPYWEKTKTDDVNRLAQVSGIIVLRDYVTIYNQRHPKLSKNKNRDQFCPTFMPGTIQPGIHSCSIHPLKSWIHQAAG
jgi:hypothetical protein